ncbi:hypothetical protein, partial [Streptomyces sp. NPDC003832]
MTQKTPDVLDGRSRPGGLPTHLRAPWGRATLGREWSLSSREPVWLGRIIPVRTPTSVVHTTWVALFDDLAPAWRPPRAGVRTGTLQDRPVGHG